MTGYTHAPAYDAGLLKVSGIHSVYYEQYGNKEGLPVIFNHGGPGGGSSISCTKFFDPAVYRVVLLDQRGACSSTPTCELRENTTEHLINDIEDLRKHLNIPKWHMVFGGSWGSTLSLLYAQAYPEKVGSLVLRGIFLVRESELAWDNYGVPQIFPEAFEDYLAPLPVEDRHDPLAGYYKLLTSDDHVTRVKAAGALNLWVLKHVSLQENMETVEEVEDEVLLHHAVLNMHYIVNRCFLEDGQILRKENMERIQHIPCTIVQGRYDIFCPPVTAWELHKAWPKSKCIMVPGAGHSAMASHGLSCSIPFLTDNIQEPGTFRELVKACDESGKSSAG